MSSNSENVVELDVRPILLQKGEPFALIMETVDKLKPDDIFVLHATFNPVPLLEVMKNKGFDSESVEIGPEHWQVTFTRK